MAWQLEIASSISRSTLLHEVRNVELTKRRVQKPASNPTGAATLPLLNLPQIVDDSQYAATNDGFGIASEIEN